MISRINQKLPQNIKEKNPIFYAPAPVIQSRLDAIMQEADVLEGLLTQKTLDIPWKQSRRTSVNEELFGRTRRRSLEGEGGLGEEGEVLKLF